MEKGINFIIINKELLQKINGKRDKAVITTAQSQRKHNVMIDCGHGGRDSGTISCFGKAEKEVTLSVGLEVAQLLNAKGYKAGVTRNADIDLALDQRTKLANNSADIFLSIHANSSANKKTTGIETYCLDDKLFTPGFSTLTEKDRSYVACLERDRCQKSNKLAHCVHKNALETVATVDRKVRPAVSQVLLGTDRPAILIEIGFLSNEHEALLLCDKKYQHLIAQGICKGIISYFDLVKSA
jgi:N-acetylmuramoyl-L-alanine amidase